MDNCDSLPGNYADRPLQPIPFPTMQGSSKLSKPWKSTDDGFHAIIGPDPNFDLLLGVDE